MTRPSSRLLSYPVPRASTLGGRHPVDWPVFKRCSTVVSSGLTGTRWMPITGHDRVPIGVWETERRLGVVPAMVVSLHGVFVVVIADD